MSARSVLAAAAAAAAVATLGALAGGGTAASAATATPEPTPTVAYPAAGLAEASGIAASTQRPGVVWVMEDSGAAIVHAYGPGGTKAGSVTLVPASADDTWGGDIRDSEALAIGPPPADPGGPPQLWVADIGDNLAVRTSVVVHVTPEPSTEGDGTQSALSYRFTYPDGPHDAETFLVDPVDARAYIVTKGLIAGGLYAAPEELTPNAIHELTFVSGAPGIISDGAFAPDGSRVVLRTASLPIGSTALVYDVIRVAGRPIRLAADPLTVALPAQRQGESVCFTADGTALLVGSEGVDEPIWSVPLPVAESASPSTAGGATTGGMAGVAPPAGDARPWWLVGLFASGGIVAVVLGLAVARRRSSGSGG